MNVGLVIHVPHASTIIPVEYRRSILLSEDAIKEEIVWATDAYCDELFNMSDGECVVAEYSRLACDVERFRDDDMEPDAKNGNGLFYTRTQRGVKLRDHNPILRDKALTEIYDIHHQRLTETVDKVLSEYGLCLIIDGHSFCDDPCVGNNLPDFCIGTDRYHTPNELTATAKKFLESLGCSVALNYPYSGSIVPAKHYLNDKRVMSLMIEVNKRRYLHDGTFDKSAYFDSVKLICSKTIETIKQVAQERTKQSKGG